MVVKYSGYNNHIQFSEKINSYIIADFASAVSLFQRKRPFDLLTLDFSAVRNPYSNGMLAIIATVQNIRLNGAKIKIILPNAANVRNLFVQNNWTHLLDPINVPYDNTLYGKHIKTRCFKDSKQIADLTNDFMSIVLGNMMIPRDIVKALEWSIYEVCDNVINHSKSPIGGYIEVVTFPKKGTISFTVADAGIGILNSLKESMPNLSKHSDAIGEAISPGVTRNKKFGQGNGLAGSLRITTMTGGSLDIVSGAGRFYATNNDNSKNESLPNQTFIGTSVSGHIKMSKTFSIEEALTFGSTSYNTLSIIDLHYEKKDEDCLIVNMRHETSGIGTRNSGRNMRTKIKNLIESKPDYPIYIDWADINIIASSFADEFIGKLFVELGPIAFGAIIRNKNMETIVKQLLDKAITQRMAQENKH